MVNYSLNNASLLNKVVSTAFMLIGLVFYDGEYQSLLPGPVAVLGTKSLVMPSRNLAAKKSKKSKKNSKSHRGHADDDVAYDKNACTPGPNNTANPAPEPDARAPGSFLFPAPHNRTRRHRRDYF